MTDLWIPNPNDENAILKFLDAIDGEAESTRKNYDKNWDENINQVRGNQWRLRRSPYFLANIIRNQVRRKIAHLTESKAQIQVRSVKADLSKASNVLYNTCRSILDSGSLENVLYRVALYGMTVGCSFVGSPYDAEKDDVDLSFIDPRRVYIDRHTTSSYELHKSQYIRIDTVLPLSEIRMRFPGRGALVKPDDKHSSYFDSPRSKLSIVASVLQALPKVYRPGTPSKSGPIPWAEARGYWIRDPQLGLDGNVMFPGGRHIIRAGDIILKDEANPYWDGLPPIDMFEWDVDFDSPWGADEVQDLRRIQEAVNRLGDAWVKNTLLGSNFKIIADLDALDPEQWEKIDNEAGLVIRKKPNREIRYESPVPDQGTMPTTIESLIRLCDLLTGIGESSRSPAQGAAALEGLQMARHVLTRVIARRLESLLERIGQKLISRVFQFYNSDRVLFQQGPTREWIAYTYERQKLLEDDNGKLRPVSEIQKRYRDFKFLVTPGSSLASSRIQRTMAMMQFRQATGIVPSLRRILQEADLGDPDTLIAESLEEAKVLPPPPDTRKRPGR